MKPISLVLLAGLLAALLAGCAPSGAPQPTTPAVYSVPVPPTATTVPPTPTLNLPVAPEVGALAPEVALPALGGDSIELS
ncbi:MAG: hypothetical protein GXY76_03400, partial [Chloroflexi bacterium]|nr:hypothetical protein [Chloroflexota bacterium]